jgi:hypothetical protein
MKMKIVSIPTGILSSLLIEVVRAKKTWNVRNNIDIRMINFLKFLFLILFQKINVKARYSR